ncbi:MAG: hypothetical protein ACSLE9_04795 [Burkholderiaceae bacterium]
MAQEIVFYHSAMQGAPSSTLNAAGAAIAVLDACLVNGFNSNTVSTLTQSAGVATATTSGTNGFSIGDWVLVAGATETAYNGRVKVTTKPAANQFTYAVPSGTPTPATLTAATAKYPPAGWAKTAAGTNNAAYQAGTGSLGLWMQVEDNNPYVDSNVGIRTRQCQGWTGLDLATVLGTQIRVAKNTGGWLLVADQKTCYLYMGNIVASAALTNFSFGEFVPFYGADAFSAFQTTNLNSSVSNAYTDQGTSVVTQSINGGNYFPLCAWAGSGGSSLDLSSSTGCQAINLRGISQTGSSVPAGALMVTGKRGEVELGQGTYIWAVAQQALFLPSLADNSVPVGPIFNYEFVSPNYTLRGRYRGIYFPLGRLSSGFSNSFQRLDNALVDGVAQSLLLVNVNALGVNGAQVAYQVDGAWV